MRRALWKYPLHDIGNRWHESADLQKKGYKVEEWTHKQIWDLITMDGEAADPRDVPVIIENPEAIEDAAALGSNYDLNDDRAWMKEKGLLLDYEPAYPMRMLDGCGPDRGPLMYPGTQLYSYDEYTGADDWRYDLLPRQQTLQFRDAEWSSFYCGES
ncbi:hypothetical protein H632_c129p2 [Helicosporidium sp. ATCC 50920]|nr:hypothetical protein H632_c129p2 [Helicosporidium sp. ATCC 50920]|eukprot:KDD76716.1 hypothetical protein H632_c129p2 [Helicosporidium sp. ATCC 50920]